MSQQVKKDWDYPVSASQVKKFTRCELAYWFDYLSDYAVYGPTPEPLIFGSAVHETIEETLRDSLSDLEDRLVANFMAKSSKYNLSQERIKEGKQCVKLAALYTEQNLPPDNDIDIEASIRFNVNRDDIRTPVSAKLDVVADDRVWDWKTGKNHEDQWVQGSIYAAAYAARYGELPKTVEFIYLSPDSEMDDDFISFLPNKGDWERVVKEFAKIIEAKQTEYFEASPSSNKCFHCDYELHCDKSRVGYGQLPSEVF